MKSPAFRRLAALSLVALTAACNSDGPIDPADQPDLPPAAGFDADFSFFDQAPGPGGTVTTWELATSRIAMAEAEMSPVLAVPFAALSAASSVTPTRSGSVWRWPISFDVDEIEYDGEIRSSAAGNQHGWDLVLSAPTHEPALQNYLWASGYSTAIGADGVWWIADSEAGTDDVVAQTVWARNVQNTINFSFASTDTTVWIYERSATTNVLTYLVFQQPRLRVTWSHQTGSGSTWASQTNLTECWNEDLHNVPC